MSYLRYFLPFANYEFRTAPDPSLADQLLNRFLATLPYPEEEFDLENPPYAFWRRTAFVGTRHRMDALYGRDFNLRNIDRSVLEHIDDLFGPLSIETVSQAIHFARLQEITNRSGRNVYVSRSHLKNRWKFPTLSVHGEDNGLADVATLARMERVFKEDSNRNYQIRKFPGFGHQDCLIGRDARLVFEAIDAFLGPDAPYSPLAPTTQKLLGEIPTLGPIVGPLDMKNGERVIPIGAGANPALGQPVLAVFVPVIRCSSNSNKFCVLPKKESEQEAASGQRPAWFMFVPYDSDAWMRLNPLANSWYSEAEGLLMVLFYDQPGTLAEIAYELRMARTAPIFDDSTGTSFSLDKQFPFPPPGSSMTDVITPVIQHDLARDLLPQTFFQDLLKHVSDVADPLWKAVTDLLASHDASELMPGLISLSVSNPIRGIAKTSGEASHLCFALASCQYPAGLLDSKVAYASYSRLAARFKRKSSSKQPNLDLLLLVGDQVYVDATAGLFDPTALDDHYRRPYEKLFAVKPLRSLIRQIPTYMMLDDHEIDDNWEPGADDIRIDPRMKEGRKAYWKYEPPNVRTHPYPHGNSSYPLWEEFATAGFPFFISDTRTERSARSPCNIETTRIMSDVQFQILLDWLKSQKVEDPKRPKFIVSSSIVLPRKLSALEHRHSASALRSDAWDGFPYSFHHLLGEIAKEEIQNVVFLSGDEHLSCVARAEVKRIPDGKPIMIHSVHSSALYAPFPFANAIREDFAATDEFQFDASKYGFAYTCSVSTQFAPNGDGFAILNVVRKNDRWELEVEFNRRNQSKRMNFELA